MDYFENDVRAKTQSRLPHRDVFPAMRNGLAHTCPNCGEGVLYERFLKVVDRCSVCGEELHHHRADDAPAYFTIAIIGKIVVGLFVWLELAYAPPYWLHAVIWTPVLIIMSLAFLPRIKGVIVGLQWANYMHGFDPNHVEGHDVEIAPADKLAQQNN